MPKMLVNNIYFRRQERPLDREVTDSFSIPVFGQVVANPCSQKAYLVIGFTLHP